MALMGAGKGAPGAAPFTPASLTGLKLWLQADSSVFTDAARTTAATADGDPIGGWADLSGAGNHWSQSTAGKRLTLKTAIQNGRNIARLDGVDDFGDLAANAISGTAFTIFVVHKTSGDCLILGPSAAANHQIRIGQSGGNTLSMYDGTNNPISSTLGVARSSWRYDVWQNGPHFWSNATNYDNGGTIGTITIGRVGILSDGTSLPTTGDVGEILIYDSALSSGNRGSVETYLSGRWAI